MFESIFLWLAIISEIIVIMACIRDCKRSETNENSLKALIIVTGVCIFLAGVLGRLKL